MVVRCTGILVLGLVLASVAMAGGWEPFRSDRALAVVDFPGVPEEKISFVERPNFKLERVSYACETERAAYRLSTVMMPEQVREGRTPQELLKSAVANATPTDVMKRDEVWIAAEKATAVRFVTVPELGFETHHYLYLTPTRLYTLIVVVPPGQAAKCDVDRFFASFKPLDVVPPVEAPKGSG